MKTVKTILRFLYLPLYLIGGVIEKLGKVIQAIGFLLMLCPYTAKRCFNHFGSVATDPRDYN